VNAATCYAIYDIVREFIMKISLTSDFTGKIILLGGIQINMKRPCEDFFETLMFEVYEKGAKTMDLLQSIESETEYI